MGERCVLVGFGATTQDSLCLTDENPLYFGEFVKYGVIKECLYAK